MSSAETAAGRKPDDFVPLPTPPPNFGLTLREALRTRRSVRHFTGGPIGLEDLACLLWAAQGITRPPEGRTAPSAGATFPLEVHAIARAVSGLSEGTYQYLPDQQSLRRTGESVPGTALQHALPGQEWTLDAAAILVISAIYERTTAKYGARGERYVHMEVGHAAQNICLEAVSLGLGTTVVGSFRDEAIAEIAGAENPLCLIPIGRT